MDLDGFWAIVEAARTRSGGDWTRVPDAVTDILAQRSRAEIADFAQLQDGLESRAYRDDLRLALFYDRAAAVRR